MEISSSPGGGGGGGDGDGDGNPGNAYKFNGPPNVKISGLDAEGKRKKRVASYKVLGAEGKLKSSIRNGFRWLKSKYTDIRYGW